MSTDSFRNRMRQRNKKTSRPKMIVDGAGVKRVQTALRLRVTIKPARVEKVVKYRCTECDEVYDTMEQAGRCHWTIGGVEEIKT